MNNRVATMRVDILITDCCCFIFKERPMTVERLNVRSGGSFMSLLASIDTISIALGMDCVDSSDSGLTYKTRTSMG